MGPNSVTKNPKEPKPPDPELIVKGAWQMAKAKYGSRELHDCLRLGWEPVSVCEWQGQATVYLKKGY